MAKGKYEKPQAGNPHQLVIRQHVIPVRTIQRFAGTDGLVETQIARLQKTLRLKPTDEIFVARRAWDEKAERGYMKAIEDEYQPIADGVVSGEIEKISEEQTGAVNRFYALWHCRSRVEPTDEIETELNGVTGETFSKDQQERFEKQGVLFVRAGGKMATRHFTSLQLQREIDHYATHIENWRWGIIRTPRGEFVMPDVPSHGLMPIAPRVMLVANQESGLITKVNLTRINVAFLAYTRNYFFGRSLQTALAGVTLKDVMRAVKKRDQEMTLGTSRQS